MTRQTLSRCAPSLTLRALTIAATICTAAPSATAADDQALHLSRVRSENPSIGAVVRDATMRSVTFRQLVDTIDGTDGLVYIEQGKCGHGVRACLLMSVKIAGPSRMLRVIIGDSRPNCRMMASIGHELRHAVEVLSDPHIRSDSAIFSSYERLGRATDSSRFETEAAMHAGLDVDTECGRSEALTGPVVAQSAIAR